MIEVINRQRKYSLDPGRWARFAARALRAIGDEARGRTATVAFVSDRAMRDLNRQFRGRAKTTDVLSFPAEHLSFETGRETLGDVVISAERAWQQARRHELTFEREIAQLILHGLLHLCGYDHETDDGRMNRFELDLRRRLKV